MLDNDYVSTGVKLESPQQRVSVPARDQHRLNGLVNVDFRSAMGWQEPMSEADHKPSLTQQKRSSRSLAAAIKHMEEGLSQLYAAADLTPPDLRFRIPLEQKVAAVVAQRRLRRQIFPTPLFSDPAWDILVELYARQIENCRVNITQLTAALPVPPTTVLRWLDRLEAEALIIREKDIHDARRVWVSLSQYGLSLMNRYFQAVDRDDLTD